MKVIVQQVLSQPSEKYPHNFRVEFVCHLHQAEQVLDWISTNNLKGPAWHLNSGVVLYTTRPEAVLCSLRWT